MMIITLNIIRLNELYFVSFCTGQWPNKYTFCIRIRVSLNTSNAVENELHHIIVHVSWPLQFVYGAINL